MISNDLTPIPIRFKYLKGQSWRWFVRLSDLSEQLDLNTCTLSATITHNGNLVAVLGKTTGISVSADGTLLDIKYDFVSVSESGGVVTITPPLSSLAIGEFRLQLLISRTDGRDSSPIFFYVDVADVPSDSDVDRLTVPQQIEITLDQGVRVATEVVPIIDRIEWKNENGLISVRYVGETNWTVWADFTTIVGTTVHTRIAKYTAESQLPVTGDVGTVYFLNVTGNKYLKYWNGVAYVNASTKVDLPKCVSSVQQDYYATFADISIANYGNRVASIHVIEDVNNQNGTGLYYFDGSTLNELLLL